MGCQYDQYLVKHKENVKKGYDWLLKNLPELVDGVPNLVCSWPVEIGT